MDATLPYILWTLGVVFYLAVGVLFARWLTLPIRPEEGAMSSAPRTCGRLDRCGQPCAAETYNVWRARCLIAEAELSAITQKLNDAGIDRVVSLTETDHEGEHRETELSPADRVQLLVEMHESAN